MKLAEAVTGFSKEASNLDASQITRIVEAQRVRVFQSHRAFPLVAGTGLVYIYGLWNDAPRIQLIIWILLISLFTILRTLVCKRIENNLTDQQIPTLYRNEIALYVTSLCSTVVVGSGYWWVCLGGTDRAVFAVTLLCCIYAIGTTINSSIHSRGFAFLLISNLGQGITFLFLIREPADIEVSVALLAIIILLDQFGLRNARLFSDSIHIREENRAQNIKLEKDRVIIEKALNTAKAANEDKNRFLAAASHDLRQPLHAMTLFLGSLRIVVKDKLGIELLDKIDETSTLLSEQFNSLLDLSKFDAGAVQAEFSDFSLDQLVDSIVEGARPEARRKNLPLYLESTPVSIHSDHLLLERLLRNLIVNAITYTEKGNVTVTIQTELTGVSVTVSDTGVGISDYDQARIFNDYYQVHNPARSKGKGSGLGLAIAKRISLLLGMRLTVSSVPGQGSRFTVSIPKRAVLTQRQPDLPDNSDFTPAGNELQGVRVLLVDDDEMILDALSSLFSLWGADYKTATSSAAVRSWFEQGHLADIAILDDMLDEQLTGLDIAQYLTRFMPAHRILLTTGNMAPGRLDSIRDKGFTVLNKPVRQQTLFREISKALADRTYPFG